MIEINGAWIQFCGDRALIYAWTPVECVKCHRMNSFLVNRGETICTDCEEAHVAARPLA